MEIGEGVGVAFHDEAVLVIDDIRKFLVVPYVRMPSAHVWKKECTRERSWTSCSVNSIGGISSIFSFMIRDKSAKGKSRFVLVRISANYSLM